MTNIQDKAVKKIKNEEATFIIIKDNQMIYEDSGIGVSCIRKLMANDVLMFKDAHIVDKVIGKAASMLLISCKVKSIHALLMSESAIKVLNEHHISYTYETLVPVILNRQGNGLCPLENSVKDIDDLKLAKLKIEETIKKLMANK